jgi:hypothetical protein
MAPWFVPTASPWTPLLRADLGQRDNKQNPWIADEEISIFSIIPEDQSLFRQN